MGGILNDIVEDIQVKPSKSKFYLKWVVRIAVIAVGLAFIIGQFKVKAFDKIKDFDKRLNGNTNAVIELKKEINGKFEKNDEKFDKINERIDKLYEGRINQNNK